MITVIDTNAAIAMALGRSNSNIVADALENSKWVVAPSIYLYEISNVMWKYFRLGSITQDILKDKVIECAGLIDEYIPASALYEEAFNLACQLDYTAYDTAYLVTCLRKRAKLLSFDKHMLIAAEKLHIQCHS